MLVSELAKEFNTSNKVILDKLKALKLKAKDGNQELNKAVVIVLRSALNKELPKPSADKAKKPVEKTAAVSEPPAKKPVDKNPEPVKEKNPIAAKEEKKEKKTEAPAEKTAAQTAPAKTEKKKAVKKPAEKPAAEKPVEKSVPAKPAAEKTAPAKPVEEAAVEKAVVKPKSVISDAPFVALKPLAKKKRKSGGREGSSYDQPYTPTEAARSGETTLSASKPAEAVIDVTQLKPLELKVPITIKDLAVKIQQKTSVLLKTLMQMGIFANINQGVGEEIVRRVVQQFGFNLVEAKTQEQQLIELHTEEEDPALMTPRAPVVTLMGHVDHGKTSLLDRIRRSTIADQEHGGITQHIGAYSVKTSRGMITFLDTPGHEAFTAMRARGANVTDIVVLVVAADEGIMPQTEEAIAHARAADVPIVVALNKMDRQAADQDRVKKQLAEIDLNPEDWGGKTIVVGVSAATGQGIDQLLEMILLEAEILELRANPNKAAAGLVVEAHLSRGRGSVASLIVQSGTLKLNDIIVAGPYSGKVKALFDDHERPIKEAGPSMPVEVLGLPEVPEAGEKFYVINDEKQAREITGLRQTQLKDERLQSIKKITLEDLYSQIQEGKIQELNVILKADVQGSVEALKDSLEKIPSEEVKVKFIHSGVGDVNSSDVILAVASNAIIIAFHVGIGPKAKEELTKVSVDVRQYRIIYDAVNDVRKALEGLLAPRVKRKNLARVEVRQVFKLTRSGMIAGCFVSKGTATRNTKVDVMRNGELAHTGTLTTLKRFKDDVREVREGFECGIAIAGYTDIQIGDVLEVFVEESIARTL